MMLMTDAERIESLGGAAKVARLLGFPEPGGTQRVHNWTTRKSGIPAAVKLEHPDLFPRTQSNRPELAQSEQRAA